MTAVVKHSGFEKRFEFEVLHEVLSASGQRIIVGMSKDYLGRFLIINDEIQFSSLDYLTYHELMAIPAMLLRHGHYVAVYGGGDFLLASQIFKHFHCPPKIVELDGEMIKISKKYFSKFNALGVENSEVVICDVLVHQPGRPYDVIFVDLTDQVDCPALYNEFAIKKYKEALAPNGLIVFYAEYKMARDFYGKLEKFFNHSFYYGAYMEFVGSLFTFGVFSDDSMDVGKIKSTSLTGDYFCREHFNQINLARLPRVKNLPETFSLVER